MKGIDVSKHNGKIDWKSIKTDFVMIRAGYGKNHIDERAIENVRGCESRGIPYGFYWFSYATTIAEVKNEANYLCVFADNYNPTLPLCYDWEYDSDSHAKKLGVKISNSDRALFARAFLEIVQNCGYKPMIYSNVDYLNKGFNSLLAKYPLWLASWKGTKPPMSCTMWQYTDKGKMRGVAGYVDCNEFYGIIGNTETNIDSEILSRIDNLEIVLDEYFISKYKNVIKDIYNGDYGNGMTRKLKLKDKGYDPELVQALINYIESES